MRVLTLLFGLRDRVPRSTYIAAGVPLMGLKLLGDFLILRAAGAPPTNTLELLTANLKGLQFEHPYAVALALWALPFAWIGLSMTVRRAFDAGAPAWAGLLFCVPVVHWLVMAILSVVPTARFSVWPPGSNQSPTARPAQAVAISTAIGVGMVALGMWLKSYGAVLFAMTPWAMGAVVGALLNADTRYSARQVMATVTVSLLTVAGLMLLFALEGFICILMAMPIAVLFAMVGAAIGRVAASIRLSSRPAWIVLLVVLPASALTEPHLTRPALRSVVTEVEVAASPEVVWPHVIQFDPLPAASEPWFRAGIAYPTDAHIVGAGVGAIRYCNFSTGSFVEPITAWEENRRLAFEVTEQPDPMRELSPYRNLHPPHLDDSIVSQRGEFLLTATASGSTILRGTTWYQLGPTPAIYWDRWARPVLRSIHLRVLRHIQTRAEASVLAPAGRAR